MSGPDLSGFRWKKAGLALIAPLALFFLNPFAMAAQPNAVLCGLLLVILWWVTAAVPRSASCLVLLAVFLAFGSSTPRQVFHFALTPNFYVIILSYLLCAGITNARVIDRIAQVLLYRLGRTPVRLAALAYLLNAAFILLIPQPFSRAILLTALYTAFLDRARVPGDTRRVLLLSIYVSSPVTAMMLRSGDIIVNYSLLEFGGLSISPLEWIRIMAVPSLLYSLLSLCVFLLVFRKPLRRDCLTPPAEGEQRSPMTVREKAVLAIMAAVVALWLTESLHGINGAWTALAGAAAMAAAGAIQRRDLKAVNLGLMLFLLTAFSIGGVMQRSGVSQELFSRLAAWVPSGRSVLYPLAVLLIVMALHMVVGSCITTLSIAVPGMLAITAGTLPPTVTLFLCYIGVYTHYILPHHHITVMVGAGAGLYRDREVAAYGAVWLCAVVLSVLCLYLPWWRLTGIL